MKLNATMAAHMFVLVFFFCIGRALSQDKPSGATSPTIDGSLTDAEYNSIGVKQNSNSGFGPNIDVSKILYYSLTLRRKKEWERG